MLEVLECAVDCLGSDMTRDPTRCLCRAIRIAWATGYSTCVEMDDLPGYAVIVCLLLVQYDKLSGRFLPTQQIVY